MHLLHLHYTARRVVKSLELPWDVIMDVVDRVCVVCIPGIRRDRHLLFEVEMYLQKGCIMVSGVGSS